MDVTVYLEVSTAVGFGLSFSSLAVDVEMAAVSLAAIAADATTRMDAVAGFGLSSFFSSVADWF